MLPILGLTAVDRFAVTVPEMAGREPMVTLLPTVTVPEMGRGAVSETTLNSSSALSV